MRWVSPKDRDLRHFRVVLYPKGPAPKPSTGKAVVTGRVLRATFTLRPKQVVWVTLFAVDLSGNYSRFSRKIVMPASLVVAKSKKRAGMTILREKRE